MELLALALVPFVPIALLPILQRLEDSLDGPAALPGKTEQR
jgi:hypothetical protein